MLMENLNTKMLIVCKGCNQKKEHHAKGMCLNCYRKYSWKRKKIICKNCKRERFHKAFGLCSTCHIKLHHYDKTKNYNYRKYHNVSIELYKEKTKECVLCGFNKIVDLHHLDKNLKNNNPSNLIGLCPNHYKTLHDCRFSEEIANILKEKGINAKISKL